MNYQKHNFVSKQTLTAQAMNEIEDGIAKIANTATLGIASDGLIYLFIDGNPVGVGIPQGQNGNIFGYVDENNTIVLKGNLTTGTYTFKYETESGETFIIGTPTIDTDVYYSVASNLTNCTINNNTKTVVEGGGYSATITAHDGYVLKSVIVTMGGNAISTSNGVINITNVTGNIVITAVAEENKPAYTNLAKPSDASWKVPYRINSSYAEKEQTDCPKMVTTNYIDVKAGDIIRVKGIDFFGESLYISYSKISQYNNGTGVNALTPQSNAGEFVVSNGITTITVKSSSPWVPSGTHIRLTGKLTGTSNDVIITKNEAIV